MGIDLFVLNDHRSVYLTNGCVTLVGNAGYAVAPISGQGALIGAYVLAGDLNQDQFGDKGENQDKMIRQPTKSSLEKILEEHDYYTDGSLEPTDCYRDPANLNRIKKGRRKIDWIFVKGKINTLRPVNKSEIRFNPTASDHVMTVTDIVLT